MEPRRFPAGAGDSDLSGVPLLTVGGRGRNRLVGTKGSKLLGGQGTASRDDAPQFFAGCWRLLEWCLLDAGRGVSVLRRDAWACALSKRQAKVLVPIGWNVGAVPAMASNNFYCCPAGLALLCGDPIAGGFGRIRFGWHGRNAQSNAMLPRTHDPVALGCVGCWYCLHSVLPCQLLPSRKRLLAALGVRRTLAHWSGAFICPDRCRVRNDGQQQAAHLFRSALGWKDQFQFVPLSPACDSCHPALLV